MQISLENFKVYIPSVTVEDSRLLIYLSDAKRGVNRDGFDESHDEFDELQKLYTLGLMQDDKVSGVKSSGGVGNNPEGISSIGVAGINIGFASPSSNSVLVNKEGKSGYFFEYSILLKKLKGIKNKIV